MNIFCFYLYSHSDMYILAVTLYQDRMIFADFSVNSQLISLKFSTANSKSCLNIGKNFATLY